MSSPESKPKNYTNEEIAEQIELATLAAIGDLMVTEDEKQSRYGQSELAGLFDSLRRYRRWYIHATEEDARFAHQRVYMALEEERIRTLKAQAEANLKNTEVCLKISQTELETAEMKRERERIELKLAQAKLEAL